MKRNPSMTEEDWRWFELWREASNLSSAEVESLEARLRQDPSDMDTRVQIFSYFSGFSGDELAHSNAEQKLSEHAFWLIENRPDIRGFIGYQLMCTGRLFKPKVFGAMREAWLEQSSANPFNGGISGNAAGFIVWNDIETASELFERAYALEPAENWLGLFVIHCHSDLLASGPFFRKRLSERVIDVGVRSLETEPDGARHLTCEYVSDAALNLGRFKVVRWCADILRAMDMPPCEQMADYYLGLVAIRENDVELAVELASKWKRGYVLLPVLLRLARELFEAGERESIIRLIRNLKKQIDASTSALWLEQIANDESPDFENCWRC